MRDVCFDYLEGEQTDSRAGQEAVTRPHCESTSFVESSTTELRLCFDQLVTETGCVKVPQSLFVFLPHNCDAKQYKQQR